jgi:hypothetical protein
MSLTLFVARPAHCTSCGLMSGCPPRHKSPLLGVQGRGERICLDCVRAGVSLFEEMSTGERRRLSARKLLSAAQRLQCSACQRERAEVEGFLPLSKECRLCERCLKVGEHLLREAV